MEPQQGLSSDRAPGKACSAEGASEAATRPILFVAVSPKYGGAEKHLLDLLRSFVGSGRSLVVVCTGPDLYSERLDADTLRYVSVRREKLDSWNQWCGLLREIRPAALVLVKSWTWCFPWWTMAAAWLTGVSTRISIHHAAPTPVPPGRWKALQYRMSYRRLAWFSTANICVSEALRTRLRRECGFPAAATETIPNGVDTERFRPDAAQRQAMRRGLHAAEDEVIIICVASLIELKRIDLLLAALQSLSREGAGWRCLILGDGPLRAQLESTTVQLGLRERVEFLGFQSDVRGYLRAADVFALTSDTEGMPLSVLEAMACGLPCVVTNVGGNAEVVIEGEQGFVVPPGDPAAIARALETLIAQPGLRASLSEAARNRARAQFDIGATMSRIRRVILGAPNKEGF